MAVEDFAAAPKGGKTGWKQDPEGVRADILATALAEFAESGLSGARMDEIAAKTRTSKRMIYYYFGSKNELYQKALEESYRAVRSGEEALELDHLDPVSALKRLTEFTFTHHRENPNFIRLVMIENIHKGQYLAQSDTIKNLNRAAIANLDALYERGVKTGVFREGLSPLRIHWLISAISFFNVSNATTFSLLFGSELYGDLGQKTACQDASDAVLNFVRAQP
ncbi:TetR/AcrR family transcriptional regulator [Roseibium limicola]|uniref:TetR family transcriptional regulator n=1 Tax=Roseibium limicola TaxID=2816037 RepID=A0A939EKN8_9HYPH|nr:TetR/AcrR family transcriptional regulator [Roseibium limicola]MBO0344366.1 TetR family transcriptional regulator [Roseibium limicola]